MPVYDVAFLVGNGTSIPYGAPLGTQILEKALHMLPQGRVVNNPNTWHFIKQPLESFYNLISDIRGTCTGPINGLHMPDTMLLLARWGQNHDNTALQQLLEMGYYWDLFHEAIAYATTPRQSPQWGLTVNDERRRIIGDLGGNHYDYFTDVAAFVIQDALTRHPDLTAHKNLVAAMSNYHNILLIDLNYDTLWEETLQTTGFSVTYGFPSDIPVENISLPSTQGTHVTIVKPHGSFNLLTCDTCLKQNGEKNSLYYVSNIGPIERFSGRSLPGKRCPRCNNLPQRHFMIPYISTQKAIRYQTILQSFSQYLVQQIAAAKKIYSIGYGFQLDGGTMFDSDVGVALQGKDVSIISHTLASAAQTAARAQTCSINAHPIDERVQTFEKFAEISLRNKHFS